MRKKTDFNVLGEILENSKCHECYGSGTCDLIDFDGNFVGKDTCSGCNGTGMDINSEFYNVFKNIIEK